MPARDTTASARPACKRRWTSIGARRVGWDTSSAVILELRKGVAIGLGEVCRMTSLDRKRVVQGKGVSVRVDLGGRRNLKKNNKQRSRQIVTIQRRRTQR